MGPSGREGTPPPKKRQPLNRPRLPPAAFRLCSVSTSNSRRHRKELPVTRPTAADPQAVPQSQPLTFVPVGHLLAAGKVQAHQGAEAEEEGEVEHEEEVLHDREAPATRRPPRAASARSRVPAPACRPLRLAGRCQVSPRALRLPLPRGSSAAGTGKTRPGLTTGTQAPGQAGLGAPVTRSASALGYSLRASSQTPGSPSRPPASAPVPG